jgi:spoIIIJ-associated protein
VVGGEPRRVEATGETVGEAKWNALRELERLHPRVDKTAVEFQVVSEGERGLLGVGYAPARVVAVAPELDDGDGGAHDDSPLAADVRSIVVLVTQELGIPCRIELEEDEQTVVVTCTGADLGMLIGKHGQTIDAIQYLANAILFRGRYEERRPVVVDAAGYRDRRQATLDALALRMAEQASATGQPVELEPMTPVERKIVHEKLKDDPEVETASEGTEPNRYVVIFPRHVDV